MSLSRLKLMPAIRFATRVATDSFIIQLVEVTSPWRASESGLTWLDCESHYEAGGNQSELAVTEYTIIIEDAGSNFVAYAPDVPGCVAAGETAEETLQLMEDVLALHIEMLRELGEPVRAPHVRAAVVQIAS
jgi:predicted RNase H-like HicB family nuclease